MENPQRLVVGWILFAFVVWIFAFRGYLTSRFELTSDALSYYDHTKFFIENLGQGIYPLWDPYWFHGAPNDFFLRRIGAFNPFYLAILLLKSMGVPYTLAYLWFLAGYYWSGMVAFYLLAMRLFNDRFIAYAGYLMLMFSALGTRLFDSYMMLVTVPLIWFFYFLTAFTRTPRKDFFLGTVLSFMILAGTYIPFYFLIILGLFLLLFFLVYFDRIAGIAHRYVGFFKENKTTVILSLMVLFFSFLPAIIFFHDSAHGKVVLPVRHGDAGLGHALTVPRQTLDWGAVEDLMYSSYFSDLRMYKFAVVYVPFFAIIVFILGFIGRINRRVVFIFLLGFLLSCGIVPHGLPFYDFLYQHIFFLKYFRNLHFFIWFFLVPLFILLVLEHWKMFAEMNLADPRYKRPLLSYVFCAHVIVFIFVWWRKDAVPSTYMMVSLSLVFWSLMVLRRLEANAWGFFLLTLTVLVQPLETYHYFSVKSNLHLGHYDYDFSYRSIKIKETGLIKPENVPRPKDTLYYASGRYNDIYQNISSYALEKYLQNKFILVDHLEAVDRDTAAPVMEHNFLADGNTAVIFKDDLRKNARDGDDTGPFDPHPSRIARRLDQSSPGFKLLAFDANHVRVGLNVPYEKFLIYNDSYDPYWHVSVNHHQARLFEVNGAFKGAWIPAGKNVVDFTYGCWWQYAMNVLLSVFAFVLLAGIIRSAYCHGRKGKFLWQQAV